MTDPWLFNLSTHPPINLLKRKAQKFLYENVNHHKVK